MRGDHEPALLDVPNVRLQGDRVHRSDRVPERKGLSSLQCHVGNSWRDQSTVQVNPMLVPFIGD